MQDPEAVIAVVRNAFAGTEYPGDAWLVGSTDGCEPEEEVGPFRTKTDWRELNGDFLDNFPGALHFFSEAALRFFLPAYLVADLRGQLHTADPCFTLTHGFCELDRPALGEEKPMPPPFGRSAFVNPRRYGALTFEDYAHYRLSVFPREEATAIVAYLEHLRAATDLRAACIQAALDRFWYQRARSAPATAELTRHLKQQREFMDYLDSQTAPEGPVA
jgi:hypothetical protein